MIGKNQDPNPGSGSGMNNPDHMSLETNFWVKILEFFDADPGSGVEKMLIRDGKIGIGMEKIGIRDRKNSDPGSGMEKIRIRDKNTPDPHHCYKGVESCYPAEIGTWSNEMARGQQQPRWSGQQQGGPRWDQGEEAGSDEEMELAAIQLPDNLTFISTNNQVPDYLSNIP